MFQDISFRIKRKLGKTTSEDRIKFYRRHGISIGKGPYFFSDDILIDTQRPWMIQIGEYCKLTKGVIILQHDYSRSVVRRRYGELVESSRETIIGNNVFIGMNSIILMGAHIGNNVVIGAGSVVSGSIPNDVVIGGVPAKIICSLEQYYEKLKKRELNEACNTVKSFKNSYKRYPSLKEIGAFWPLFAPKDKNWLKENDIFTNLSGDNEKELIDYWYNTINPVFNSYDEFLEYCKEIDNEKE